MNKVKILIILSILSVLKCIENKKLSGIIISSTEYLQEIKSVSNNTNSSKFESNIDKKKWIGLELYSPHIITKIGWSQKNSNISEYLFGIFEGANEPTFIDGIPLFMFTEEIKSEEMNYIPIKVNYPFKYLRYIGPINKTQVIENLEFYGYEASTTSEKEEEVLYQPTSLPLVVIHTEDSLEPKDKTIKVNFISSIINNGKINNKGSGKITIRGNHTMKLIKRPYKIKFNSKINILDLPAKAKKWTLLANYCDKALIRNSLALKLSSLYEMKYTPSCRFVDLMLNSDFKGNYYLCDQLEVGKNRIEITEMDATNIEEPEVSGGYLIEVDAYAKSYKLNAKTLEGITYSIKYPKKKDIENKQLRYIKKKFNDIENEVYSGIVDSIDKESFIKYIIIQEISANVDMCWSVYITKERNDDKFYFGPVWDFDIAFGNDKRLEPLSEKDNFIFKYSSSAGTMKNFIVKIFNNERILQSLKDGWKEIRDPQLIEQNILDYIDQQVEIIKDSRILNFKRWDILINSTYEKEIDKLKQFFKDRFIQLGQIIANSTIDLINKKINRNGSKTVGEAGKKSDRIILKDNENYIS